MAYAVTILGLDRDLYEWMLPSEYHECLDVWQEEKINELHLKYDLERFNAWLQVSPPNTSVERFYMFPWEELQKGKVTEYGKANSISKVKSTT